MLLVNPCVISTSGPTQKSKSAACVLHVQLFTCSNCTKMSTINVICIVTSSSVSFFSLCQPCHFTLVVILFVKPLLINV